MIKILAYIFALAPLMCQAGVPWDSNGTKAEAARVKDKVSDDDKQELDESLTCSFSNLGNATIEGWYGSQCAMVNEIADCDGGSLYSFKTLYFCDFEDRFGRDGKKYAYLPLALFLLAVAMYNLGSTADAYLSPALEAISDKLKCSESLAGVTLLALGNGAPDVFASISAGGTDAPSVNLQVAALTGSALFITTVVMWMSLRASEADQKIKVTRIFFLRDCLFINITSVYLLVIMLVFKELNLPIACGFLGIYVIFVIVVVIQSKLYNKSVEEGEADDDDVAIAETTARANDFIDMINTKREVAGSAYKQTGLRAIGGGSVFSKQKILDNTDETSLKLRKQSTEFKGLKRMFSLNNDPKEELTNDQDTFRSGGNSTHIKNSNKSLTMRSRGSSNYEGDNLIKVDDIEPKSWNEDEIVEGDGRTAPQIDVDMLDVPTSDFDDQDQEASYKSKKSFAYMKKGSVVAKLRHDGIQVHESHVSEEDEKRKTLVLRNQASGVGDVEEQQLPDQLFIATRIKNIFKRTSGEGVISTCWLIVEIPLNFLRNYSCPPADHADWDRNRMSILPLTVPISFCYLQSWFAEGQDVKAVFTTLGIFLLPGLMMTLFVQCRTTKTRPPVIIMTFAAVIGFLMSIVWIGFTSDVVIDLLEILGIIIHVPKSVLGLTLLAWGNCLGDMSADVAMTKKGFGEMAITGCMAGPIFNILVGLGLSMITVFVANPDKPKIDWYLFDADGKLEITSLTPFVLITSLMLVQMIILANACINNYSLNINMQYINLVLYFTIVISLVVYVLTSEAI